MKVNPSVQRRKFNELTLDQKVSMTENIYAISDNVQENVGPKLEKHKKYSQSNENLF